jgi:hypothetical protein
MRLGVRIPCRITIAISNPISGDNDGLRSFSPVSCEPSTTRNIDKSVRSNELSAALKALPPLGNFEPFIL